MRLPIEANKALCVLVLRTLGESQDNVAQALRCRKTLVGSTEQWFSTTLSYPDAVAFVNDRDVERIVAREFGSYGLLEETLARAQRVTHEDILRHFRSRDYLASSSEVTGAAGTSAVREHHKRLRQLAGELSIQTQLSLMEVVGHGISGVVSARRLAAVHGTPDPASSLGGNWGLKIHRDAVPPAISLVVESAPAFSWLREHLATCPIWEDLDGWKRCLSQAVSVADRLVAQLRQRPELADEPWIEPDLPPRPEQALFPSFIQTAVAATCGSLYPGVDSSRIRDGFFIVGKTQSGGAAGQPRWTLEWRTPSGRGFNLGVSGDPASFNRWRERHARLRQELSGNGLLKVLVSVLEDAAVCEEGIHAALADIGPAVPFPGSCQECRPFRQ